MPSKAGTAFAVGGIGLVLAWSGFTNKGVLATARDLVAGNRPSPGPKQSFSLSGGSSGTSGATTSAQILSDGGSSSIAQGAVGFAVGQVGKPYVWGATGPDGYDCSGLCYAAYKSQGKTIPRVSEMQMFYGTSIPAGQEIPGDLMFPEPGHVVMCIGGGQCVEAPHTGLDVRVRAYSASEFVMRRRVA